MNWNKIELHIVSKHHFLVFFDTRPCAGWGGLLMAFIAASIRGVGFLIRQMAADQGE
jgi:hypothetical protein